MRSAGTRTPDLYRVKNELKSLNPFACLAFPAFTPSIKAPICHSFVDEFLSMLGTRFGRYRTVRVFTRFSQDSE